MANVYIQGVSGGETATIGDNDALELDTGTTSLWVKWSTVKSLLKTYLDAYHLALDGWIPGTGTWTYSSADSPTFVISTSTDLTGVIGLGYRIKLTQTTAKYFIVTAITSSTITVYGGTDYTLANAAISSPYYSPVKSPFGFPMSREKWTVTVSDTTTRTQASPTANTYYNPNTTKIDVPIGSWEVSLSCVGGCTKAASNIDLNVALSTSTSSVSNEKLHRYTGGYAFLYLAYYFSTTLVLTTKASYYVIISTGIASTTSIELYNAGGTLEIRATSTYL